MTLSTNLAYSCECLPALDFQMEILEDSFYMTYVVSSAFVNELDAQSKGRPLSP